MVKRFPRWACCAACDGRGRWLDVDGTMRFVVVCFACRGVGALLDLA